MYLAEIIQSRKKDVEALKSRFPLSRLKSAAEKKSRLNVRSLKKALTGTDIHLICELKKASPSAGLIRKDFQPLRIASHFEFAGAAAISILTEPHYFKGRSSYLKTVRQVTNIPLLRKDFIFDTYQLYESVILEADAFLLIASVLTTEELKKLIELGKQLTMEALVEVHNEEDLSKALQAGATIIGINNRDLKSFKVDPYSAINLIKHIPKNVTIVVESGISSHKEIMEYKSLGVHSFLVGTSIMKSDDVIKAIHGLLGPGYHSYKSRR